MAIHESGLIRLAHETGHRVGRCDVTSASIASDEQCVTQLFQPRRPAGRHWQCCFRCRGVKVDGLMCLCHPQINSEVGMDMTDISQNSLLCGMKDFDKAVQNMEETILVPSR